MLKLPCIVLTEVDIIVCEFSYMLSSLKRYIGDVYWDATSSKNHFRFQLDGLHLIRSQLRRGFWTIIVSIWEKEDHAYVIEDTMSAYLWLMWFRAGSNVDVWIIANEVWAFIFDIIEIAFEEWSENTREIFPYIFLMDRWRT